MASSMRLTSCTSARNSVTKTTTDAYQRDLGAAFNIERSGHRRICSAPSHPAVKIQCVRGGRRDDRSALPSAQIKSRERPPGATAALRARLRGAVSEYAVRFGGFK